VSNPDGRSGIFPFDFNFRIRPTAPVGRTRIGISAIAGLSHATGGAPLTISKS
jgi:hypothetical protein